MKTLIIKLFVFLMLIFTHVCCSGENVIKAPIYWSYQKPYTIWVNKELYSEKAFAVLESEGIKQDLKLRVLERKGNQTLVQVQLPEDLTLNEKRIHFLKFFSKNGDQKPEIVLTVMDKESPKIKIIENSRTIMQGGSGVVIFQTVERNLESLVVKDQDNHQFNIQKFQKEDYYISLIQWYLVKKDFKVTIFAKDRAGNVTETPVVFKKQKHQYPVSKIQIQKTDFLKDKKEELAKNDKNVPKNEADKYDYLLKKMGQKYQFSIAGETVKPVIGPVAALNFSVFKPIDDPKSHPLLAAIGFFITEKNK